MKISATRILSYNAKKALLKGIIIGIVTTIVYLTVVVITTPSLPPIVAIYAAFKINSVIIFGLGIGVGTQIFLASYSKGLGCRVEKRRKAFLELDQGVLLLAHSFHFSRLYL
jgi:hypothetical protein